MLGLLERPRWAGPTATSWTADRALDRGLNREPFRLVLHLDHVWPLTTHVSAVPARPERTDIVGAAHLGLLDMAATVCVLSAMRALPGTPLVSWDAYLGLTVPAVVTSALFWLGLKRLATRRPPAPVLLGWALWNIVFTSAVVWVSGGGHSMAYRLYALNSLSLISWYPRRSQFVLRCLGLAAYLAVIAGTGWHVGTLDLALRMTVLVVISVLATIMGAERQRWEGAANRRAELLATVAATAREVYMLDAAGACELVVGAVCELGMQASHISLFDESSGTYHMTQSLGIPQAYTEARPPATAGIVGMVRTARATVSLDPASAWDYVVPIVDESHLTSVMGSPLWVDGELVGVLAGATRAKRQFGPADVEAFELLAGIASRAVESASRFRRLAESEALTRHQASHDDLTGLPNRRHLDAKLALAFQPNPLGPSSLALLVVDVDDFKHINDTLGHKRGDQVLVAVAARLATCVRGTDAVARLSGDDFAVLAPGLGTADIDHLAQRLLASLSEPLAVEGGFLSVTASVGVALASTGPQPGDDRAAPGKLLSHADMAMHEAKRLGRNCCVFFDQAMSERLEKRLAIEAALPQAIARGEISVHYQPIFELDTMVVTGCEALLRWESPVLGRVPPSDFIPVAEETGAIVPIGEWVLRQSLSELRSLHADDQDWRRLTMSVNLSPRQLCEPDLVQSVVTALMASGVPANQLTLEITESSLLQDAEASRAKLSALAGHGVQVALDDFGTGYSSLAYLQQLQVHSLKVDKCFVDGVANGAEERTSNALVRSVIELSRALELSTVAEGIETQAQVAQLLALGCHLGQGYVFSPAVSPAKLRQLLRQHSPARPVVGAPPS